MDASIQGEAADQHISKTAKRADATPEGFGQNTESRRSLQFLSLSDDIPLADTHPLSLSDELLDSSPKDPMVWRDRRLLVVELKIDLEKEWEFVGKFAERDCRNCLVWHYRRWIVEELGSDAAGRELKFTKKILSMDTKNHLAWSHREWIIKKFDRRWWLSELQYCHEVLEKHVSNIFAWDQMCRAVRSMPNMDEELRYNEASFTKKAIEAHPGVESPWTYLKYLYMEDQRSMFTKPDVECIYVDVLDKEARRVQAANPRYNMVDALVDKRGCVHALNLILDLILAGYEANENKRLVAAVDVLYRNCRQRVHPNSIRAKKEIIRKVCALMLSLEARRIRHCNFYHGCSLYTRLQNRRCEPPLEEDSEEENSSEGENSA